MRKIFIDCGCTHNSNHNTGIQRVVRNVVNHLLSSNSSEYDFVPIETDFSFFKEIDKSTLFKKTFSTEPITAASPVETKKHPLKQLLKKCFYLFRFLLSYLPFKNAKSYFLSPPHYPGSFANLILRIYLKLKLYRDLMLRTKMPIQKGDILLLLDSSWNSNNWREIRRAKKNGAIVIAAVYDIIPFTYPKFFDSLLVTAFQNWYKKSVKYIDIYISISKSVSDELSSLLKTFDKDFSKKEFAFFHLGSDIIGESNSAKKVEPGQLTSIFSSNLPTFLTVCTLEPRKNHDQILQAADKLWEQGFNFNVLFIGKNGWKVEDLIHTITSHPMYNKNLFWKNDINDYELSYAYSNSRALVFASIAEGFGLPIVESQSKGLPVIASDIPIHREIGKNDVIYFKLFDVADLSSKIAVFLDGNYKQTKFQPIRPLNWKESASQFINAIGHSVHALEKKSK